VRPVRIVLDAQFLGESSYDALVAMGDALMDALIDAGATDPFVSVDAGTRSLLIEVVVEAEGEAGALAAGAAVMDAALAAGVENGRRCTGRGPGPRTSFPRSSLAYLDIAIQEAGRRRRACADRRASRVICARMACSARRVRSAELSLRSGSTCSSKRASAA
jgi:hypothetical protein